MQQPELADPFSQLRVLGKVDELDHHFAVNTLGLIVDTDDYAFEVAVVFAVSGQYEAAHFEGRLS